MRKAKVVFLFLVAVFLVMGVITPSESSAFGSDRFSLYDRSGRYQVYDPSRDNEPSIPPTDLPAEPSEPPTQPNEPSTQPNNPPAEPTNPQINSDDQWWQKDTSHRFNSYRDGTFIPNLSTEPVDNPQQLQEPTNPPSDGELPPIPEPPAGLTEEEAKAYRLLNEFRVKNGVPPVEIDMEIVRVARMKAQDMVDNDYFGHVSPTYGSVGQMLRDNGISYSRAGECLARAGTITKAHLLLEYSTKGHREIMLRPDYTKVGIGVVKEKYSVTLVEIFVKP
ncbi:MAG: hypothetical protein PWQ82_637 [Thermosediminibacterales bacterium]|nr:hypothetical protein [Thermosediminibacterales bacterium]MDK2835859.1 hypothetical protein [Thermosediminibacterales bacterium]